MIHLHSSPSEHFFFMQFSLCFTKLKSRKELQESELHKTKSHYKK